MLYFRNKARVIFLLLIIAGFTPSGKSSQWELKRKEAGIVIYTRNTAESEFQELKAITTVESSLSALVALLKDIPAYPSWVYLCGRSHLVKYISETEEYYYTQSDAPWPVNDREIVIHSKIRQDALSKTVYSESKAVSGYIPSRENTVRVTKLNSCWKFTPKAKGLIEIEYQISVHPGGVLPPWLVNMTIATGPYNTLLKMKEEVRKPKYKSAKYLFLKEP